MNVNLAHLHLLINHFPVLGTMIGLGLFLCSFFGKNQDLRRASYIIFAAMALIAIPTFESGMAASRMMAGKPGISDSLVQRHEGSAMLSIWFMLILGALALVGLWKLYRQSHFPQWNVMAVLVFSLLTVGLMARTANTGGEIRYPEVRTYTGDVAVEGPIGSFVHMFEPVPENFTQAMVSSKWWWGTLMGVHFMGLAMLIGTIGIFDLRIMGFLKQLPVGPLHRFMPWAMGAFGVNVATGVMAFIGQPMNYTFDSAFWLKMLALMLLGLNVAVFYMTDVFARIENLGAGEDAPMSARLIAASSLVLWIAVITLGRYIQGYIDTMPY
jgi:uncharacterized membrane protein